MGTHEINFGRNNRNRRRHNEVTSDWTEEWCRKSTEPDVNSKWVATLVLATCPPSPFGNTSLQTRGKDQSLKTYLLGADTMIPWKNERIVTLCHVNGSQNEREISNKVWVIMHHTLS